MELKSTKRRVHAVLPEEKTQAVIVANAKAFSVLSSNLYSDKIAAIIREVATNARDGHLYAGNENPFRVELPSKESPEFVVRDYGVGLTHEQMKHLYLRFFESTKDGSKADLQDPEGTGIYKEAAGCLGLGCKSPLGYTNTFTVTCFTGEEANHYSIFLDKSGGPALSRIGTTQSDEPRGVRVTIPVKLADIAQFKYKSVGILKLFNPQPTVVNNELWTDEILTPLLDTANLQIWPQSTELTDRILYNRKFPYSTKAPEELKPKVLMGPVAYALDTSQIQGWPTALTGIPNLLLKVHMGAIDVPPSRESVSYDAESIKAIQEAAERAQGQLKQVLTNLINTEPTYIGAVKNLAKFTQKLDLRDLKRSFPNGLTHTPTGKKIKSLSHVYVESKGIWNCVVWAGDRLNKAYKLATTENTWRHSYATNPTSIAESHGYSKDRNDEHNATAKIPTELTTLANRLLFWSSKKNLKSKQRRIFLAIQARNLNLEETVAFFHDSTTEKLPEYHDDETLSFTEVVDLNDIELPKLPRYTSATTKTHAAQTDLTYGFTQLTSDNTFRWKKQKQSELPEEFDGTVLYAKASKHEIDPDLMTKLQDLYYLRPEKKFVILGVPGNLRRPEGMPDANEVLDAELEVATTKPFYKRLAKRLHTVTALNILINSNWGQLAPHLVNPPEQFTWMIASHSQLTALKRGLNGTYNITNGMGGRRRGLLDRHQDKMDAKTKHMFSDDAVKRTIQKTQQLLANLTQQYPKTAEMLNAVESYGPIEPNQLRIIAQHVFPN